MRLARWKALVLGTFLASILGGCVGNSNPESGPIAGTDSTEEPPSTETVTAAPGVVTAVNKGVVLGRVVNDAESRVPGARVSLVQTDLFADTLQDGSFRFENLTPESYMLRTEAAGYRVDEREVQVRAGNATNVTVVLLPLEDRGAGYRSHTHDLWGGKTEYLMLETDMEYTGPISAGNENPYVDRVLGAVYYSNQPSPQNSWCRIPIRDTGEGPEIVLPGTGEIRVKVTWSNPQGSTLEKMGLGYTTAISSTMIHLPKQAPGTVFSIPVKPEEADSGHQRYTLWNFYLEPQNSVANAPADKPAVSPGTFHVTITLVRAPGDLPADPPHEDHWKGNDTIVLRPRDRATTGAANSRPTLRLDNNVIVPPGTAKLRITFLWAYNDAANGTAADRDYNLLWKTADMSPQSKVPEFRTQPPVQAGNHFKIYEIIVKPTETDGFYQRLSTWAWAPSVAGYEKEWYNPDPRSRTFYAHIVAFRDPAFE